MVMLAGTSRGGTVNPTSNITPIEAASFHIDQALAQTRDDSSDLKSKLSVNQLRETTVSGFHEREYRTLANLSFGNATEFNFSTHSAFPVEISDQIANAQSAVRMGLFPDILRAWVSCDNVLYMWNYETNSDLVYYANLQHSISTVGLCMPKPGIFDENHYLLCISTVVEVVLLTVFFVNNDAAEYEEMRLIPQDQFKCSAGGSFMRTIACTAYGRIFLGDQEGSVFELEYFKKAWFSSNCKLTNLTKSVLNLFIPKILSSLVAGDGVDQIEIDESRNILYTRAENGSLKLYDLGDVGRSFSDVAVLSMKQLRHDASGVCQATDAGHFSLVVSISAIPLWESRSICLVGVTKTGARLYFTCYYAHLPANPTQPALLRPETFKLVHVRLPAGIAAPLQFNRPSNVHCAVSNREVTIMSAILDNQSDCIYGFSATSFHKEPAFVESICNLNLGGRAWCMKESKLSRNVLVDKFLQRHFPNATYSLRPLTIATQHWELSKTCLIMTNDAIHHLDLMRPVDLFARILAEFSPESREVNLMFTLHTPEEACAMCLVLICSYNYAQFYDLAYQAYFLHGGTPRIVYGPLQNELGVDGQRTNGYHPHSPYATTPAPGYMTAQQQDHAQICYSARHQALNLYFSRIVAPLWNTPISLRITKDKKFQVILSFDEWEINAVLEQLKRLKNFIDQSNLHRMPVQTGPPNSINGSAHSMDQSMRRDSIEAMQLQRVAMDHFYALLCTTTETVALLSVLSRHPVYRIVAHLPPDVLNQFTGCTLRNLVISGRELSSDLCTSLISFYLGDNAQVDVIANQLRDVCPGIYTSDDATVAKANELLHKAKSAADLQKLDLAHEAVLLYKRVPQTLDLHRICLGLFEVGLYVGIPELVLACVQKIDPEGFALAFYKRKNDVTAEGLSKNAMHLFSLRMNAYNCVTNALNRLIMPHSIPEKMKISEETADRETQKVVQFCFQSQDELAHINIFDWLVEKNFMEILLKSDSPFLESYLKRMVQSNIRSDSLRFAELLCGFYERKREFFAASQLMAGLAEQNKVSIKLTDRLQYLNRALLLARSSGSKAQNADFLQSLEDKYEVALVQRKIDETLSQFRPDASVKEAIKNLNSELYTLQDLYSKYAEVFNLSECMLDIIRLAEIGDQQIIESLWAQIIDREVNKIQDQTFDTQQQLISKRLVALSNNYRLKPKYFPTRFIIRLVARKAADCSYSAEFIISTFRQMKISMLDVLSIAYSLFKSKDNFWFCNRARQLLLLTLIKEIITNYVMDITSVSTSERHAFKSEALDALSACMLESQTLQRSTLVDELNISFRALQSKLEKSY